MLQRELHLCALSLILVCRSGAAPGQAGEHSLALCPTLSWRRATRNNSGARSVIVLDPWPHVGIGHSIRASAQWLRVVAAQTGAPRSLRFASCLPHHMVAEYREPGHELPACNATVRDPTRQGRLVSSSAFDVHEYLTLDRLPELRARPSELARGQRPDRRVATCEDLEAALEAPTPLTLLLYGLHLRELIGRCAAQAARAARTWRAGSKRIAGRETAARRVRAGRAHELVHSTQTLRLDRDARPSERSPRGPDSGHGCLSLVGLTPQWEHLRVRPCAVGLHLRSLALDNPACNLIDAAGGCEFGWRGRRCASQSLEQIARGCGGGGARFATADEPRLYARTRPIGWADLGEVASVTWNEGATIPYPPGRLGDAQSVARTVVAFLSLARCTRAIVAPVDSQFSATAALAARVPLAGCCTEVENAVAEFERVAELKDSTHHLASGRGAKIGARREFRARGMSAARGVTRAAAH